MYAMRIGIGRAKARKAIAFGGFESRKWAKASSHIIQIFFEKFKVKNNI
jgi:hypothetical protein